MGEGHGKNWTLVNQYISNTRNYIRPITLDMEYNKLKKICLCVKENPDTFTAVQT